MEAFKGKEQGGTDVGGEICTRECRFNCYLCAIIDADGDDNRDEDELFPRSFLEYNAFPGMGNAPPWLEVRNSGQRVLEF